MVAPLLPDGSKRVSGRACEAGIVGPSRSLRGEACGRKLPPSSGIDTGVPSEAAQAPVAPHPVTVVCGLQTSHSLAQTCSQTTLQAQRHLSKN